MGLAAPLALTLGELPRVGRVPDRDAGQVGVDYARKQGAVGRDPSRRGRRYRGPTPRIASCRSSETQPWPQWRRSRSDWWRCMAATARVHRLLQAGARPPGQEARRRPSRLRTRWPRPAAVPDGSPPRDPSSLGRIQDDTGDRGMQERGRAGLLDQRPARAPVLGLIGDPVPAPYVFGRSNAAPARRSRSHTSHPMPPTTC